MESRSRSAGDIAEFNKGYYKILGRSSTDIIKSGGYKISALQVRNVWLGFHDSIHYHKNKLYINSIPGRF